MLQTGGSLEHLDELHGALEQARFDPDRAEALLRLHKFEGGTVGTMAEAALLLEQTKTWSLPTAQKILHVRKRFPRVSAHVAVEVLRRNDDDPHAAGEMLAEFEARIQRLVMANSSG